MTWPWLHIDITADEPAYEQITRQIVQAIHRGDLKPGDSIISERKLAETLYVSRGPVRQAYQTLENNGLIRSVQRRAPMLTQECTERAQQLLHNTHILTHINQLVQHAKELDMSYNSLAQLLEDAWKAY